jgi:hypothetical protein
MTPEERARVDQLCNPIKCEKNPVIFDKLIKELLKPLEAKHHRIHPGHEEELK